MADTKISGLTAAAAAAATEEHAVNQGGASKKVTLAQMLTSPDITTGFTIGGAAGSGKIIKGDGTKFAPTAETFAAPGSTGNQLISDGTNFVAQTQPVGAFFSPAQTLGTSDTYITNSNISVPASTKHRIGMRFRWTFNLTKTSAGVAGPVWVVRFGTNGTTADTSRATWTEGAQTASADTAHEVVEAVIVVTGSSGKIWVTAYRMHELQGSTGFCGGQGSSKVSAAFDLTVASSLIGVSVNAGASSAWTVNNVLTEIYY